MNSSKIFTIQRQFSGEYLKNLVIQNSSRLVYRLFFIGPVMVHSIWSHTLVIILRLLVIFVEQEINEEYGGYEECLCPDIEVLGEGDTEVVRIRVQFLHHPR